MLRRVLNIESHLEKIKAAAALADKNKAAIHFGLRKAATAKSADPKIQKLIDFARKHGPPIPVPPTVQPVNKFL